MFHVIKNNSFIKQVLHLISSKKIFHPSKIVRHINGTLVAVIKNL